MNDKITIRGLPLWVVIGINSREKAQPQMLFTDVVMTYDTRESAQKDDVTKTIDYRFVCEEIKKLLDKEYNTIERLAHDIAETTKQKFNVKKVEVLLKKPQALKKQGADYASLRIVR